ncbi:hypothetical protein [uncultured Corynebacterium sp.]|uniref:hypothetical protein n=1 Tax=uncultured Corynebacterium sp. TaxID=159447 RepID=UPI00259B343D|nr:hypothetical protein [uncultured Corynebacterium sp.]
MSKRRNRQPHCQYCGEPVKKAVIFRGEKVSFDASPDPAGTYMMQKRRTEEGDEYTYAEWLTDQEAASLRAQGVLLWKLHRVTCPKWPGRPAPRVAPDWLAAKLAQLNIQGGRRG